MNNVCIACDKRWQENTFKYVNISMCTTCLNSHKAKGKKSKDYSDYRTAIDLVYDRLRSKAVPVKERTVLDYLRKRIQ